MCTSIIRRLLACGLLILAIALCVVAVPVFEKDAEPNIIHQRDSSSAPNPLDYAPDISKDEFPPYPPIQNSDGSNITAQNLRGVKLFGWTGCSSSDVKTISDAYDDFQTLAKQEALWKNIDWNSQAAKDIWGHGGGNTAVTDDRKKQIQQIYKAAEQVRGKAWYVPPYDGGYPPPGLGWRYLWIEITCSSVKGDPENGCGDRPEKDPKCPGGRDPPPGGMKSEMEAFSNPLGKYSKITFCETFFLRMMSLGTVIDAAKKEYTPEQKNNIWEYQNRARTFFHEITHLNYFMNAPGQSPYVDDLQIPLVGPGKRKTYRPAYGPDYVKIIANRETANMGGFYAQRNADSYAWFAVAKYVEQEIGKYPSDPIIKKRPAGPPRDGDKKEFAISSETEEVNYDDTTIFATMPDGVNATSDDHRIPNCPDHPRILSDTFGVSSVDTTQLSITCDMTQISGIPYNVFHGKAGNVYDKFCFNIDSTTGQEWKVDVHGENQSSDGKSKTKRTPPPNANTYEDYSFELKWETDQKTLGCGQNPDSCRQVFAAISTSGCGHQASEQNIMAGTGKVDVKGCGTYSYKINSPEKENPSSPSTPSDSTPPDLNSPDCKTCGSNLGASSCSAKDGQCLVDECKNDKSCQACKLDCNQYK